VEFYLVTGDTSRAEYAVNTFLNTSVHTELFDIRTYLYRYLHEEAIGHLFRVASGMDSMVIGEPQITGQVKDAYRQAVIENTAGAILSRFLHKTFSVAKRVRTETELASRAISISYVAVELAKKIFGDLTGHTVMLIGAGEMAELAATHLNAQGVTQIIVASRTLENAQKLAEAFHGLAIPLEKIVEHLAIPDILICSTAADRYILGPEEIKNALKARKRRPIFIIDIAVPRNIDPQVNELENVYLYDMDDLQSVVQANIEARKKELKRAEVIVAEEIHSFLSWLETLHVVPTIIALREKMDEIRKQELEKALAALKHLNDEQKQTIASMTNAIINKILHQPITHLKKAEQEGNAEVLVEVVQQLFSLAPNKEQE
jgi:glutamyl-tRNA reductase